MLTFNDSASQSQRTTKSKRSNRKIKLEMDKLPKFKKNKEQLEGEQEELQVVLGQRML